MAPSKQTLMLVVLVITAAIVLWLVERDTTSANLESGQSPVAVAQQQQQQQQQQQHLVDQHSESTIHQITLPHDEPEFPSGPGRELFISRCTVCHTLRYITMQPDFPKKVWAKEVAKMINTYGAHISGEEAKQITEYLSTIKGAAPAAHASTKK
ncbi:MAG TPA: hypothetical protein V6C89_13525 [Drouetiella sp.]|jgi:sulfite dehydrogenase (cytochrome) subunit B